MVYESLITFDGTDDYLYIANVLDDEMNIIKDITVNIVRPVENIDIDFKIGGEVSGKVIGSINGVVEDETVEIELEEEELSEIMDLFNTVISSGGNLSDIVDWLNEIAENDEIDDSGLDFEIL
jgi:hypothetical protein